MSAYTSAQIRAVLGIKPGTLRVWAHRGLITKLGRDLYDGDSVIARWQAAEAAANDRQRAGSCGSTEPGVTLSARDASPDTGRERRVRTSGG